MTDAGCRLVAVAAAGLMLSALTVPLPATGSPLPAPSRTMFKCVEGKKVMYTDRPCLGAQRLDVVPSRGLNKLSGTERIGADVASERRRELFAEALKPLTGMEPQQFAIAARRQGLNSAARRECQSLDPAIAEVEAEERISDRTALGAVQRRLLSLRQRYHELRC